MGFGIQTLPTLLQKLERSPKDWCLVAIHDSENPTRAGRQLEQLLDDLDDDSGDYFDFFLPGYEEASHEYVVGYALLPGEHPARWRDRTGNFDHRLFRDFVMGIEHLPHNRWRYNGDCSFLLFQTFRRPGVHPDSFWHLEFVADYNLDDIVLNGQSVNQFLRRMCIKMETIGGCDVSTVKNGLDEVYRELIMPPENRTPEQELRLREGTSRLLQSHPEREYVFVSYSTRDRERALTIRKHLESEGMPCWMAPRDIPAGSNYAYVIERAISGCGIFLVLVSPESVKSVWVNKEVLYSLGKLQQEGRFHAAWLDAPFDLESTQSGMAFALQDVQIDDRLSKGDADGILFRFLTKGLRASEQVPVSMWRDVWLKHLEWANDSDFSSSCPWNRFSSHDWQSVLKTMSNDSGIDPEAAIPFSSLSPAGWAMLLTKAPHFSRHCDKWDEFAPGDWLSLLRARPEFADNCKIWTTFTTQEWERLLFARPELANYRRIGDN
ncbi:MAG: toll/interleukin-1 receptor domain-containing protein [Kiritimatiellae bacterium]|nr:toll/interleukin-1 receptor domain-containing protein [Kiritimatiellia bacterium]